MNWSSNAYTSIPHLFPIRQIQLMIPEPNILVNVLENGLKQHFMNVKVEWVNCLNLSQEPFNLAAPGICGQTTFIELGDFSYMQLKVEKKYNIKDILRYLGRNYSNSFIFGNGVSRRPSNGTLGELVMNASFSPEIDGVMEIKNRSSIVFLNVIKHKCDLELLADFEPTCNIQGSFFLCDGLIGPVLQVRVRKHRSTVFSFSGFIDSMRQVLQETFGSTGQSVVLGGEYIVRNALWNHEMIGNSWELSPLDPSFICKVDMPSAIISTFNSSTVGLLPFSPGSPIKLNGYQSTHFLYHHNASRGRHFFSEASQDGIEYLGYFSPAEKLYRLDEPPTKR
ncbi:ester hydrolase C11orf54 homolog isoform X1 [Formica exsecta]|uniref:ester hydrolase C11orf54 homolog isoform X1 n=1 Tax=Formica exsecta TaxID=72781 RepID=UPI0011411DF5|nr:ester hydrolase C11orf54 homolog isoform X1 [Formica exsecta]XP_029661345.1 ester hydrolase C11orf54 homolog isoform X1 [Formica exsecta]